MGGGERLGFRLEGLGLEFRIWGFRVWRGRFGVFSLSFEGLGFRV